MQFIFRILNHIFIVLHFVSQEQISKLAATTPTLDGLLQGSYGNHDALAEIFFFQHLDFILDAERKEDIP